MIPIVPEKRRDGRSSFIQLVSYLTLRDEVKPDMPISPDNPYIRPSRSKAAIFDRLIDYLDRKASVEDQTVLAMFDDGTQQIKSGNVVCETNCFSLETASAEMNAVAMQNTRCVDAVYHCILSWREEDTPTDEQIFDSARYCLKQLGMADHQYVVAVHRDTDNVHCHIAANRINPKSYRAANLYNDVDTLHKACRHLEMKHDFTPDNGAWKVNGSHQVVRSENDFKSIPRKAKQLEYYADSESLFSYATGECRQSIGEIVAGDNPSWSAIHTELIRAGLELKPKGEGLAIYSREDESLPPIKASSLHPDLTLYCLEETLGKFEPSPEIVMLTDDNDNIIHSNYKREFIYEPRLHARDNTARIDRRLARADAREDLKARYQAYKSAWTKPKLESGTLKQRYQHVAKRFAWQKARARIAIGDPLLRKLTYHIIEVERMKAIAALRIALKAEKKVFNANPENRRLSYRAWVEQQALNHDQAAIAQLRGWSYRLKRANKTPPLSENGIRCAAADDCRPFNLEGYDTQINRDGVIQYRHDGIVQVQDRGERIEIANPFISDGQHIAGAMTIAEEKSGEVMVFEGSRTFVNQACGLVGWFNEGGEKPLPLSDPQQRILAGYEVDRQASSSGVLQPKSGADKLQELEQGHKPQGGYRPQ
ncbi:TraI/MobA(P) family conjugative relaxase [Yersinia massiliensis]|uniref:TraI/MobA(P) family conjugative relaxase n=1 Tax=Yersinia massiliensis TaxID=419257 RepID=UPI0011A565D1|nr:TraI/MobA(P) family conjugative relaxase [Yersinia massiliensis]MCB5310568.1 relaxase/mobilization nuclease domain-containing protein [Yersinia massiliensis]